MDLSTPALVEAYFDERLLPSDPLLSDVLARNATAGLPDHGVAPNQGALLALLVGLVGGRRVLEVGTLGGYSTIWLARGLASGGRVISLEIDPDRSRLARENLTRAGFEGQAEVRVGPAAETMAELEPPFDLVFIDADKASNVIYWNHALRLTRPGGLILVDNVVRGGDVLGENSADSSVDGVRRLLDAVHGDPRVEVTALQTVGSKGYDGLLIARVRDG